MNTIKSDRAWYALRRTLPNWSFEENLKELIEYLPKYRVNEVIVKVDTEEFCHGQPVLEWIKDYQNNLFRIKQEMDNIGIVYSINPWITVGHNDRGRDSRTYLPGLRTMIGHDGVECICCACPISEVWREHVAKVWTIYAETKPHIIWIEDDIRTFNHQPLTFGCFCSEHMKRFSERVGKNVSREELVTAILQAGTSHPWRKEYFDMQAEIMNDTVSFLAKTVHKTSPETCMGLMSSGPRNHCLEGRRWHDFADALADGCQLYSRPPMGNYSEASLRGFYYSHDSIKLTRYCLPDGVIEQTEVENVPFTLYSKSANFTFLEMAISFAYGSHGITMNFYDHCGTPMEREPEFGRIMREKKDFLCALAERCQQTGSYRGIRLLHHEKSSYEKELEEGSDYCSLTEDGGDLMGILEAHGLPTTYDTSEKIVAVSGQQLNAFSDAKIKEMLAGSIFLDAEAAWRLSARGFSREIGLESIEKPVYLDELGAYSAEEFFNPEFGGQEKKFLTVTIPGLGGRPYFSKLVPEENIEPISYLVDPDAQRKEICMYAYKNQLGGRIVVHAIRWDGMGNGPAFNHTFRREQLQGIMMWLADNKLPICVDGGGVFPLAFRKDCGMQSVIGLFNLTLDPWKYVEFSLDSEKGRIESIEILTQQGKWTITDQIKVTAIDDRYILRHDREVPYSDPFFITVNWIL